MQNCLFKNLVAIVKHEKWSLLSACFMVLLSNALLIINPLIFRQALISMEGGQNGWLADLLDWAFGGQLEGVFSWGALLLVVAILSAFFKYRMRFVFLTISRNAEAAMRMKIFRRIQEQSASFFDRHSTGELMSRLSRDVGDYQQVLGAGIMYPINFLTLAIPALAALLSISAPMAALAALPILVLPIALVLMRRYFYALSRRVQSAMADLSAFVQEQFSAVQVIKSYAQEKAVFERFKRISRSYLDLNRRLVCTEGSFYPLLALLGKWVTVALILLAGFLCLRDRPLLSVADFTSFMWIQSYLFVPILMLGWVLPVYERGRAAYDRLKELYDEPVEVSGPADMNVTVPADASLNLKQLSFRYPHSDRYALRDLEFMVKAGGIVGITGPVGSGKSTLLRVLSREYEVDDGMVFLGGRDIKAYPLGEMRRQVVMVEQNPFIFSESLGANVRYGSQGAGQEELLRVLRQAGLEPTLDDFPNGLSTVLGERGTALSGGQRQRVAIARALLADRPIFLLDDIFSALDTVTENLVFQHIKSDFPGATILLVTHRLSILEQTDHIIYLSRGRILEQGTHSQLVQKGGHYAAMAELSALTNGEGS